MFIAFCQGDSNYDGQGRKLSGKPKNRNSFFGFFKKIFKNRHNDKKLKLNDFGTPDMPVYNGETQKSEKNRPHSNPFRVLPS